MPGFSPENTQLRESVRMKLSTLKNWGESSGGKWTLTISDTKPAEDVSTCVDLPLEDDAETCYLLAAATVARNQTVEEMCNESSDYVAACCICGGGESASSIRDQLVSWSLLLYGHDLLGNLVPTVSPAPTFADGQFPVQAPEPTVENAPTINTLGPTSFLFRKPTYAPTVQSVTGPSSGSLGCATELYDVNECLSDRIDECSLCMQQALSGVPDETSCSTLKDVLCTAFSSQCDSSCGSCDDLYLQYMSCASAEVITGGCQFYCDNTTNGGGVVPTPGQIYDGVGGAPTPVPASSSSSLELKVGLMIFISHLVLQML